MTSLNKLFWALLVVLTSMTLIASPVALAKKHGDSSPGNSANAPGQAKKLSKGSSDVKGNLKVSQHIYYEGDTIEVSIKFSRGWELLADGTVDGYVVVISPETELLSFPVDPAIGPSDHRFFSIELEPSETLPVGQYQLGLILTISEGDPANIADWYNGFRGLLDMEGVLISDQILVEDADMDGECDFDADGDGFCDEETGTDNDDDVDDDSQITK